MAKTDDPEVTIGSGNVFADLGLRNAAQERIKAELTLAIYRIIRDRGLTQTQAGNILGVKQPVVSTLMRNRSGTFSVARLMTFLNALDHDIEISIAPKRNRQAETSVTVR